MLGIQARASLDICRRIGKKETEKLDIWTSSCIHCVESKSGGVCGK